MNDENLKTLSDNELERLVVKARAEIATRARRKEDAIARIKQLAGAVGVGVSIKGARGRPAGIKDSEKAARTTQAK